nr:protein suex-1-like [Procambarus clarkii]
MVARVVVVLAALAAARPGRGDGDDQRSQRLFLPNLVDAVQSFLHPHGQTQHHGGWGTGFPSGGGYGGGFGPGDGYYPGSSNGYYPGSSNGYYPGSSNGYYPGSSNGYYPGGSNGYYPGSNTPGSYRPGSGLGYGYTNFYG